MNRWILPVLGALALHFTLFTVDPGFTRPALMIPQSRAVSISLVEITPPASVPAPENTNLTRPIAAPPPEKKRIKSQKVKPVQAPAPQPPGLPLPAPAQTEAAPPEPDPPENDLARPDETAIASVAPAESEKAPIDQVQIQTSVPLYHRNPPPDYPSMARRRNYQGTTLLEVLVDRKGNAANVRVHRSSGYAILDRSAMNAVRQWRFEPARRMGRAVEMWVQVPVRFELK